ncbi:type II toxin-antitoxin system PemK/MazF family toxin [Actinoplanes sp. NPDC024001]|uniref:type II toxin-antitoxin system PemK/MazF family toxin n=1 Tax=Actinoplanes sp. NPDC024001 TaxID=3154598 RepID=UPI0033E40A45
MVKRGQVWTLLRGGSQHRVLVISNDEYNMVEELAIWGLTVVREAPHPNHLAIPLTQGDPLSGAWVRVHGVVQILDRTSLRDNHGFVSHTTMSAVEEAIREFLELP